MKTPPNTTPTPITPTSIDPYSIPDTPYISAHSNKATDGDGNLSASYQPNAYDSEYNVKDLSARNNTHKPENKQLPPPPINHKRSIFTLRRIIIGVVIIIIIILIIIIGINIYFKHSKQENIKSIEELTKEETELEKKIQQLVENANNSQSMQTQTTQNQHNKHDSKESKDDNKRRLVEDLEINTSSSLMTKISNTMFMVIVIFTIILGLFISLSILHL